jgi:hypothetical protein
MPIPRHEPRDLGWLDADLFVHPFFDNPESATCRRILDSLMEGTVTGSLDDVTVHEVLYVLWRHLAPKYPDEAEGHVSASGGKRPVHGLPGRVSAAQATTESAVTSWVGSVVGGWAGASSWAMDSALK